VISESTIGDGFADAGQWGGPETVLLVEDEAFVRNVTAEVLESAGYSVVIARSAAEALEKFRGFSTPLDLLLSDVVMPGISGHELAREFESLCPNPPGSADEWLYRTPRAA
jgi:CheY-like chemotaxis protein